jgi:hypothetical protein
LLTNKWLRRGITGGLASLTILAVAVMPAAAAANPGVVPPTGAYTGSTYGQWSEAWWRWAMSIPAAQSPLGDTTGAQCGVGQSGPVWFLAGTPGGQATRHCTIPAGKAILVPIINAEWSVAEANANASGGGCFVPGVISGTSEQALRACAAAQIDHVKVVEASVDGTPLRDLQQYRVASGLFSFNAVDANIFGVPAGTTSSVSDGYWVLLAPLSPGTHTIHFRGVAAFPELQFTFEEGVDYTLTVAQP